MKRLNTIGSLPDEFEDETEDELGRRRYRWLRAQDGQRRRLRHGRARGKRRFRAFG